MRIQPQLTHAPISPVGYAFEGPERWMRNIGIARVAVLAFLSFGALFTNYEIDVRYLPGLYGVGFFFGISYLHSLYRGVKIGPGRAWAHVLFDFSVVALTISYTDGPISFFTFILIGVVFETVLLLGLGQGLMMATIMTAFMLVHTVLPPLTLSNVSSFELWYNFLVQCLALFLTAYVSAHWHQKVHRMQRFQREILDNMTSGFLITDHTGFVTVQNMASSFILGLDKNEAVGKPVQDVLRVDGDGECPVVTALRSGQDFTSYEFRVVTKDGEVIPLGITTNRMAGDDGKLTGVIVSFSDLTQINRMREELRQHDRLAVVGELAAGLAHEIRNPVAVIRGAVDELRLHPGEGAVQTKLCDMAIRESDHLNDIVSGFLDFAREPKVKRETFDVRELVDEVAESLDLERAHAGAAPIELSVPEEDCEISGDSSQIRQVFVNLAKNGMEAMDGEGALRVSVLREPQWVEIRFEDNGPGIEPDAAGRIFDPFYTTKAEGVGMGLAVCLRIVTAHDGTIRAFSRGSGGCSMNVRLPLAQNGGV